MCIPVHALGRHYSYYRGSRIFSSSKLDATLIGWSLKFLHETAYLAGRENNKSKLKRVELKFVASLEYLVITW
jgi:hypothetical protein